MTLFSCKRLLLTFRVLEEYQSCIYYRYLFGLVLDGYFKFQVSFHGCFLKVDTSALILGEKWTNSRKSGQGRGNPDKGNFDLSGIDQFVHFCVNLSIFAEFVHFCAICPDCRLIDGQPSGNLNLNLLYFFRSILLSQRLIPDDDSRFLN